MKTNNKCAAVRLEKSKLMAALAVLAVAFVVFAAIPAVDAENTADSTAKDPLKGLYDNSVMGFNETTGVYTLTNNATITLDKNVEISQVRFAGTSYTLTVKSAGSTVYDLTYSYDFGTENSVVTLFDVKTLIVQDANVSITEENAKLVKETKDNVTTTLAAQRILGSHGLQVSGKSVI